MPSKWNLILNEYDQMTALDQRRAISRNQIEWLLEIAELAPSYDALDLGFGCGISAIAMAMGGRNVVCINNAGRGPWRTEAEKTV